MNHKLLLETVSPAKFALQWHSSSSSLIVWLLLIDFSSTHSLLFAKLSHFFSRDSLFWASRVSLSRDIRRRIAPVRTFRQIRHPDGQRSAISSLLEEDISAKGIDQARNHKAVIYGKQLHETLKTLQTYLPLILQSTEVPKVENSDQTYSISSTNSFIASIYSLDNFTLLGPKKEVLAAGITEFATLSSIVVAAVAAAYRLRNALFSAAPFTLQQQESDLPVLDCHIILSVDANSDCNNTSANIRGPTEPKTLLVTIPSSTVYVQWSTEIPAMTATSFTVNDIHNTRKWKVQGLSEISLDEADSRITVLRLLDLTVNNTTIIAIGEALAALRQMSLPLVVGQQQQQSFFVGLMRDILQIAVAENNNNIDKQGNSSEAEKYAPIYVTAAKDISSVLSLSPPVNNNLLVPIDTYCSSAPTQMPGSNGWMKFMESRDAILEFCRTALPNLASYNDNFNTIIDRDDASTGKLSPFFEANATLIGLDGKELLRDRSNVLNLYKNLAAFRYTTFGDFTIKTLKANYSKQPYLTVRWQTTWPISVEGTDRFIFNGNGLVERIEQIDWKVQGSPMKDAEWVRTFVRAVMEIFNGGSGTTTTTSTDTSGNSKERIAGEQIFSDLLKRAVGVASTSMRTSSVRLSENKEVLREERHRNNQDEAVKLSTSTARELSGEAANSLYQITRALHREIPLQLEMVSQKNGRITAATPAARFLTENVELRGLLNEVIAGDRVRLQRVFATAFASLRAASQSAWIDLELHSPIALEVTRDSNLKMKISIGVKFPKLSTSVPQPLPQPLKMLTSLTNNPSLTTLESMEVGILVLFYIDDGGKISQIRILETRINGMLTPADVVSKWLLDASETKENSNDGMPASIRAVLTNALAWATRSKSSSGEK